MKIRSVFSVLEATLGIYHRFGRKTDVVVATLGHLGSSLGATNAKNHYFFALYSPIELAFEATTPPKAAFFLQMGAPGVGLVHAIYWLR